MQRMHIFVLLPQETKTLQNTEQITGVQKQNKKPIKFRNPDLARSGEKNHRINKLDLIPPGTKTLQNTEQIT